MIYSRTLVLFLFFFQLTFTQTLDTGVTFERNGDNSVTFSYFKDTPGSVFAILKFTQLGNARGHVVKENIQGYGGEMITLKPIDESKSISFSYSSRSIVGNIEAKPDFQFKYVLPFKSGKEVKVRNLNFLGKQLGNTEPKNWASFQFLTNLNDTICAIRKGVVVNIVDDSVEEKNETKEYSFMNKVSSILIEHEDGTLADYGVLKKDSFMVEIGDTVFPSTPLALAGTYDKEENSHIRLSIYYLDKSVMDYNFNDRKNELYSNQKHLYAYVDPIFYVNSDGSDLINLAGNNEAYTTFSDEAVIQFEMSKREKKRWKK